MLKASRCSQPNSFSLGHSSCFCGKIWALHRIPTLQGWVPFISLISSSSSLFSFPFPFHHCCGHSWTESEWQSCAERPCVVLVLLQPYAHSPVSIGAWCFNIRLLRGMLSALIHYPGHALNQLECKIFFSGVARRLCQHCRVYVLALQLMFSGQDSSVLLHGDSVVITGKIDNYFPCWALLLCAKLMPHIPRDRFKASWMWLFITGLPGPLMAECAVVSCSGFKRFTLLFYYFCLFVTRPCNYVWHLIDMEGDEWPDAVASFTPCWAVYNFTHILHSRGDHTEGGLVGTCPRGLYAHGVTQASALADNDTFGYLLPREVKLSPPAAMPSLPSPVLSIWGHSLSSLLQRPASRITGRGKGKPCWEGGAAASRPRWVVSCWAPTPWGPGDGQTSGS